MIKKLKTYLELAVKNSGSLFVLKIIGITLNYLVLMLILYFYNFEGNGVYASFLVQSTAIKVIVVFGLDYLLIKEIAKEGKDKLKISLLYFTAIIFNIIIFTIIFKISEVFYNINSQLLFGVIILSFWRLIGHYFRALDKMKLFGFFEFVIIQITVLASLFICNYIYKELHFIDMFIIVNTCLISLIIALFLYKTLRLKGFIFIMGIILECIKSIGSLYKKAIHFVLTNSVNVISMAIIYHFISERYSDEILGIYDTVFRFALILTLPLIATNGRVMVLAAKYYNNNKLDRLKTYIIGITRMLIMASSIVLLGVVCFYYLFSTYYSTILKDYWFLFLLLAFAQLINNWAGPVGVVLQATDNEKAFNKITIFAASILLITVLVFTKYYSITIIGALILLQIIIINFFALRVQNKQLGINPYKK